MIQFDEYIFQMGWFNHQPVIHIKIFAPPKKTKTLFKGGVPPAVFVGGFDFGPSEAGLLRHHPDDLNRLICQYHWEGGQPKAYHSYSLFDP